MDFDFHYYGTLSAAKFAGYSEAEARQIALAAQFVDEYTPHNFDEVIKQIPVEEFGAPRYSSFDFDVTGMIDQGTSFDRYLASKWVPFHFLPSLCEGVQITIGCENSSFGPVAVKSELDSLNCGCITLPSGDLYKAVKRLDYIEQNDYMAIGLKMHVLADTFAHQGFVGYRKADVNGVEKLVYLEKDDTSSVIISETVAIGHAAAGHYPDFGYANYEYVAGWQADKTTSIKRCNPTIFADAYIAMVEAMNAFRNVHIDGAPLIIDKEQMDQRRKEVFKMLEVKISSSDFQEECWIHFLNINDGINLENQQGMSMQSIIEQHKSDVVAYFKDSKAQLKKFNDASHAHHNMVSTIMKNRLGFSLEEFPELA